MPNTALQLLATDPRQSVLLRLNASRTAAFLPFGYSLEQCRPVGYSGLHSEPNGVFLLGNGYRAYRPLLLRFTRPDAFSPFRTGGVNCYAYCGGDPVNRHDPDGRTPSIISWLKAVNSALSRRGSRYAANLRRIKSEPDFTKHASDYADSFVFPAKKSLERSKSLPEILVDTRIKFNSSDDLGPRSWHIKSSTISRDSSDDYHVTIINGRRVVQ